jgi:hypothetical protein
MSNDKQQTAVKWFHQKTWALKIQLEKGEISIGEYANTYATLYEQAKEMEKERIETAYNKGTVHGIDYPESTLPITGEQYYNKTYGDGKQ